MANKLIRPVTKIYTAGTPSIPPQPARCFTVTREATRTGSVGGALGSVEGGGTVNTFVPVDGGSTSGTAANGFLTPVYRTVIVDGVATQELVGYTAVRHSPDPSAQPSYTSGTDTICYPATEGVEGTPAQVTLQNAGPDWQASARSISTQVGDVTASFDVNPEPRLIVGFATRETGPNQNDIRMGVAFVTSGVTTQTVPIIDGVEQAPVANFVSGQKVALTRASGRFFIRLGGDVVYSAESTTEDPVFLDAMLYTSADYVENPEFTTPELVSVKGSVGFYAGVRNGAIPMAVGFNVLAKTGVYYADGSGPGGVPDTDLSGANITLAPLFAAGSDKPYAGGTAQLSPLVVTAEGGLVSQSSTGADLVLAPLKSYGTMASGGVLSAELELRSVGVLAADRAYAEGAPALPRLSVYGDDGFGIPNYYGHNDSLRMTPSFATDPSLFASIYETLELETEMSLATLVSGTVLEGLILDPSLTAKDFLTALIESGVNLASATQLPNPEAAQYAFNAMTGAATRYSGFGFTQFTRVGGTTYAIKPDGLYRLRPGDDNGERRSALVDFGAMAFGVQHRKNLETMYLGMTTDGEVYAKLKADDGNERVYRVIQREPTMRVRTGKGITAREWSLKLEIVDATRVDLDNVDFVVGASVRRWTR